MSIYRPKGSKVWVMDFCFQRQRIRETTGMTSITRAREVEAKRRQDLRDGRAGIRRPEAPHLFSTAAAEWIEVKKPKWSASMLGIVEASMKHLQPVFGKRLVIDIEAREVGRYQKARQAEGSSNRTINIEVGCLRGILKRSGSWARLQPDVQMLQERQDVGHALSTDEETALLAECSKSRSRLLLPFVMLAIETGSRYGTLRRLQWKNVDFAKRSLTFGRDKTAAGSGRTVPLTERALHALQFWAQQFPAKEPEHYVFPSERYGGAGAEDAFGFTSSAIMLTDPSKPIGSLKVAWEQARKRANLKSVRFHDLRHTSVSRMINARIPLPIIAKIVGWSHGTLTAMAARYGHFSLEEMRSAMESVGQSARVLTESPQNPPQSPRGTKHEIQ